MNVEIWSDIVCPWCYIGKRRFERALRSFDGGDEVRVTWRSFQLDPEASAWEAGTADERLAAKLGGDMERARALHAHVTALAAEEGLSYRFDRARSGNTFMAHRLLHLAARHGLRAEAKERLMHGYFTEGLAIGDPAQVAAAVAEVGVPEAEARTVANGDAFAADVRADVDRARRLGIGGVPFFVLDGRVGVSGAQPSDVFLQALRQADEGRVEASTAD